MQSKAATVEAYIAELPQERIPYMEKLRSSILTHLPRGFEEIMNYGMIGYVVPLSLYPSGYHCDPKLPLPFMGLASQKNAISFYHMGIYANPSLLKWFTDAYVKQVPTKLDMGKSCIRFKKPEQIPFELIGELVAKVSVAKWIACYEQNLKK